MSRSRASAKAAGSRMERLVADTFAEHLSDLIDRRVKTGAKDKGDIAGVRVHGQRVTVEVKDTTRAELGTWVREAEAERVNDGNALAGIVVHKRVRQGSGLDQFVTMTMRDLLALLTGERPNV